MRIAKGKVHDVIDFATALLKDSAGPDGITSRKDVKNLLAKLKDKDERALVAQYAAFADKRDYKPGARLTAKDLDKTAAYTKATLIDKYDVNNNGISKAEKAKMSRTGQLAVALAAKRAGAAFTPDIPASAFGKAIAKLAQDAVFISEIDSTPVFVEGSWPGKLDAKGVLKTFKGIIAKSFDEQEGDLSAYTAKSFGSADKFLGDLVAAYKNAGSATSAQAYAGIRDAVNEALTQTQVFKVGPKDAAGELANDRGAYLFFVVGKTKDNKLAGFYVDSFET